MFINIISWIILGAAAGWLASKAMKRDAQMGAAANIIVGILGAVIGGFLFNLLGLTGSTGFNLWTLFVATIGAVVLIFLLSLFRQAA